MTDTLFIHLPKPDPTTPVMATVRSATGSVERAAFVGPLSDLTSSYPEAKVVGLIPGSEALSTDAVLPKVGSGQIRKMLPFALEEQIAGELDQQHFAMGRPSPLTEAASKDGLRVPVVVLRRERIEAYLAAFRSAGLEPAHLYLDEACIAAKPGDVIGWVQGDEVFLRSPTGAGLRCHVKDLVATLEFLPPDPPLSTLGLQLVGRTEANLASEIRLDQLQNRFSRVLYGPSADPILDWLVAQRALADPVDLLQGEFTPRRDYRWVSPRWKLSAALATGLLSLVLVDKAITWRSAVAEEAAIDLTLSQGGVAPTAVAPAPPSTLRRALTDLANAGVRDGALVSIAQEGEVVRVTLAPNVSPEAAKQSLSASGWRVELTQDEQARAVLALIDERSAS
jgi:general secretion pathway protein L